MNPEKHQAFINYLGGLAERQDRQALAVFRRSLKRRPGQDFSVYLYLGRFLSEQDSRQDALLCLVAGLYALAPSQHDPAAGAKSLGRSLARYCEQNPGARNGMERHMTTLLNATFEDLPHRLRQVVKLLAAGRESIDWLTLLTDLNKWDSANRLVQRRWAKHFWGSLPLLHKENA